MKLAMFSMTLVRWHLAVGLTCTQCPLTTETQAHQLCHMRREQVTMEGHEQLPACSPGLCGTSIYHHCGPCHL